MMSSTKTVAPPQGLRFWVFASPQLALATLGLPIVIYLPAYYAGPLGLGLVATGLIFMIARLWDVVTDPLLGWAADRFPTRYGRRKIWMVVSTPPMAIAAYLICFPPAGAGAVYLTFWLFFIYIFWTMISLCHIAWAAELSDDYDERSKIQGRLMTVYFIGLLLVLAGPLVIASIYGDSSLRQKVETMGLYAAILLPITVLACVLAAREPAAPPRQPASIHRDWRENLAIVTGNPALVRILTTDMLAGLSNGISSGLFVYFTGQILKLDGPQRIFGFAVDPGALLLCFFAGAMIGIPLWLRLSYRIGKHRAVALSAVVNCCAYAGVLLLPAASIGWAALFFLVNGIAFGAPPFLDRAILADVVDLDQTRTGEQRSGLFFALMTTTNKIGYALPVGLLFPVLALVGFNPEGANTAAALSWLMAMIVVLPLLCNIAIVALMWRFPIDRAVQADLRQTLEGEPRAAG